MKLFNLSFSTLILRFYLLMGIVIGAFFLDMRWLALLALPVFFACLMGVRFRFAKPSLKPETSSAKRESEKKILVSGPTRTVPKIEEPVH